MSLEDERGGLTQIQLGTAVPLADAGVADGDGVADGESELLPRGVGDAARLVGEFALVDGLVVPLIPDGTFPDRQHAGSDGDVAVVGADVGDLLRRRLVAGRGGAVAVFPAKRPLCFLQRDGVAGELL